MKKILEKLTELYQRLHLSDGVWRRARSVTAIVLVFVTTYSLIIPAITLDNDRANDMAGLNLPEQSRGDLSCHFVVHTHTDACYSEQPVYDEDGNQTGTEKVLSCGKADWAVHQHDENCYRDGQLICQLPENEEHVHDAHCYTKQKVLTCGQEETPGHQHTDACYETHTELVCGNEEHIHGDECYEEDPDTGDLVLVCGLEEHVHSDACYETEKELVCGQEEYEGHTHTNACYTEEKVLICDKLELHTHNMSCFETGPNGESPVEMGWVTLETDENGNEILCGDPAHLVCGKVELLKHQHDDSCFLPAENTDAGISADDFTENSTAEDAAPENSATEGDPSDTLIVMDPAADENQLDDIEIITDEDAAKADAEKEGKPDGDSESSGKETSDGEQNGKTAASGADADESQSYTAFTRTVAVDGASYSLRIHCAEASKIPENAEFRATAIGTSRLDYDAYRSRALAAVDNYIEDEAGHAEEMPGLFDLSIFDKDGNEIQPAAPLSVSIDLGNAIADDALDVYAVHFPGTSVDTVMTPAATNPVTKAAQVISEKIGGTGTEVIETTDGKNGAVQFQAESLSVYAIVYTVDFKWEVDGETFEYSMVGGDIISLKDLIESLHVLDKENTDISDFTNDIADVEFSDESLVKVVPVTEGITAAGLRQKYDLVSVYSDELTDAQIEAMNDKEFHAPDLAIVSLDAFSSDEIMTITMNTGEVFKIMVSDAQIRTDYISASGENYEITVTYDASAQIPDHAKLNVSEIKQGTKEYTQYMQSAASKLNMTSSEVSFARFFDIEIVDEKGGKVEPKTPVQVEIAYKDSVKLEKEEFLKIVHFAEEKTEVITDVDISADGREISYMQGSFSVTGTIAGSTPANNEPQMILVKDGNRYYIVNNDASLTEVGYDEASGTVSVTDPMLWTIDGSGSNRHIYFHSEATGFGNNQVASDYFRRYLDPGADTGTTEENRENVNVTRDYVWDNNGTQVEANHIERSNQAGQLTRNMMNNTTVAISGDGLISHGSNYLAIERDAAGTPVRLVGNSNSSDAARFVFATASKVPSGLHLENAVNHIDISIQGDAAVKVPLAYGDYYDAAGNKILTVSENTNLELKKEQAVNQDDLKITTDDMKRATIVAMDKNGNEIDDAFYVTGFSANTSTDYSTVQVRIEGRFLCADLRGTEYETIDGNRYDGNFWTWPPRWADDNYVNAVRQARLNNIVDYTVTVIKPVTFNLVDPNLGQLYDANGHKLTVTMDVAFSGSFNYWDYGENERNSGNECPPLQGNAAWRQGDIPNHDMSGMDFVLKGDAEHEGSPLVAIEIMKVIRDENGNTIQLAVPVTNTFDIYQNKSADRNAVAGYNVEQYEGENPALYEGYGEDPFHTKSITVGESGSALMYDYTVSNGMYYIEENKDTVPETVTAKNGKEYTYVKTYIETEYVRRGDQYDSYKDPMHVSKDYTKADTHFRSSPEVVGYFHTLTGEYKKSGFLEYYVYNIYTSDKELPVEKVWAEGTDVPEGTRVKVGLRYDKRLIKDKDGKEPERIADWKEKSQYQPVVAGQDGFAASLNTEMTLRADTNDPEKNWKGVFENLPNTLTDSEGNVYEVDYYAEETAVLIPDEGSAIDDSAKNQIADYEVNTQVSEGKVVITNKKSITSLDVEKTWGEGTTPLKGTEITVDLYAAKRLIRDENGQAVNPAGEWSEPEKVEGKSLILKADAINGEQNWKGTFTDLPKTATGADGEIYELNYSAKEVSVKIPHEGKTSVDENSQEILQHFDVSEVKTDAVGDDDSNGKVVITNTKKKVTPKVTKAWEPTPTDPTAYARVQLKRYMKPEPEATETEATVIKRWDDSDNRAGKRPESITVTLLKNGSDTIDTITLNESNGWSATVCNLPVKEGDNKITYTWTESDMPDGYSLKSSETEGTVTTLTNQYTPTTTSMTVKKIWDDAEDQDGKRPESLTATLKKNGVENAGTVDLSEANDWTATIDDLPIKDGTGTVNTYVWSEDNVPEGYEQTGNTAEGGMTLLTNTHTPEKTKTTIKIIWDGSENENEPALRPEEIQAELSNGRVVTLNEANNWEKTVSDLDKYYEGKEISYTWEVPALEEYEAPEKVKDRTLTNVIYKAIPEKDTVMVTLNTALYENLPEGWNVNIYNVTVNGQDITGTLGNLYMTSYSLKPVSFEVPKNSTVSYHYQVSNNIRLNGVTSQDTTIRSFNTDSSGNRDVMFKVKTHDVDVYNVITGTDVALNPDIIPEPKYMNVTIRLIREQGSKSTGFGWNPPIKGVFSTQNPYKSYDWLASSTSTNEWTYNGARVETDMDDPITYGFESFSFWGLDNDDLLVISSNATLTGPNTFTSADNNKQLNGNIKLEAQEGDVTIEVRIVPKSSLQTNSLNPLRAPLRLIKAVLSAPRLTGNGVATDGEVKNRVLENMKSSSSDAPEGYVEDEAFNRETGVRLILNDENGWTRTFPEQDKYDSWGREYIYYVEEIAHSPEEYQLTSIEGNVLSEEGVTITNTKDEPTGGLTITKTVTVNGGSVPENNKTIADGTYTFTITGPGSYSETRSITVVNGEATERIVLDGLKAGSYMIEETDSDNPYITLAEAKTLEVQAGDEASANIVSFTNDLKCTTIDFAKNWSGMSGKDNTPVTYTLCQIAEPKAGGDPVYDNVYVGTCVVGTETRTSTANSPITFTVTKNSPVTVSCLPLNGVIETTPVTFKYYALEAEVEGFAPDVPNAISDGTFTITNTPIPPSATFEDVEVEKNWIGDGADQIGGYRFKLTQERAELSTSETSGSGAFHPITIRTIDGDGTKHDTVYYVAAGKNIAITAKKINDNAGSCTYSWGSTKSTIYDTKTISTGAPRGGYVRVFELNPGKKWDSDWSISATGESSSDDVSDDPKTFIDKLNNLNYSSSFDGQLTLQVNVPSAASAAVDGGEYVATAENWKAKVQKVPYYYYDRAAGKYYTYRYRVEEVSIISADGTTLEAVVNNTDGTGGESPHFTVTYNNSGTPLKITNTLKNKLTLNIVKIDAANMITPLENAQFTIKELAPEGKGDYRTGANAFEKTSADTDEEGKTSITDIPDGYYEISETKSPDGYVLVNDGKFYVSVKGDEIKLLLKDTGKTVTEWQEQTLSDADKLEFDAASKTVKIGNTPGASLPHTGGPGTRPFTILGSILILGAGLLLWRKRRTTCANQLF
ncbi:MAG: Cna B-type domain-containing protein [Eubacterium sp.]|nr:Cna B-type domain-containing protein [Eubacterium sp.]